MKKFNERLSFLMDEVLKVSGNSIGSSLDMNVSSVFRYKNGTTPPSYEFIVKFCNFYGISANWLVLEIGPVKIEDLIFKDSENANVADIYKKKSLSYDIERLVSQVNELKEKYGQ